MVGIGIFSLELLRGFIFDVVGIEVEDFIFAFGLGIGFLWIGLN